MTKKKFFTVVVLALLAVFMLSVFLFSSQRAYAAESIETPTVATEAENQPIEGEDNGDGQTNEPTAQGVSESVKQYLISVYGEEWETYYNQIVEQWGSVEKYLLNASENLPDKYKYKAQDLILSAGGYVPLIANCILIVGGIAIIIYQHLKNKKINRDLNSIKAEQDQEITGDLAIMDALKAIFSVLKELTPGEQFNGSRATIEGAEVALDKTSEEIKKDA